MSRLPNGFDRVRAEQRRGPGGARGALNGGIGPPVPLAPGRVVRRVARKRLPNGEVVEFVYALSTSMNGQFQYETWELVEAPALACSCSPIGPDDVVCCSAPDCSAIVCARRHSGACASCGKVFCSSCLQGLVISRARVIVCRACARQLTARGFRKLILRIRAIVRWVGADR